MDQKPSAPDHAKQTCPSHAHDCKISEDPTTSRSAGIPVLHEPFFFLTPAGISGHVKAAITSPAGQSRGAAHQWSRRAPWSSSTSRQDPSLDPVRMRSHPISPSSPPCLRVCPLLLEEEQEGDFFSAVMVQQWTRHYFHSFLVIGDIPNRDLSMELVVDNGPWCDHVLGLSCVQCVGLGGS
jgi:hypothetical protein